MRCPYCSQEVTQVKDSRPAENGSVVRRRRGCTSCLARFTTFERVHFPELNVLKKDGRKVSFDRDKLARSIRVAMRKRPVSSDQIEDLVSELYKRIEGLGKNVVKSSRIGQLVMEELHKLDTVAYVRFASVYRDFRKAGDFRDFVKSLPQDDTSR